MAKKFIINDNTYIAGEVAYHADLIEDHSKIIGGGRFYLDDGRKSFGYMEPVLILVPHP